jgi:hypothetical protein
LAITYPLSTPTNIGIANIIFSADNATAISQSPFTFSQQVIKHQGERWRASISLPPMKRVDAEFWVAFLLSLRGQYGTFLLGDPNCTTPQGSAKTTAGTPVVMGGSQTGQDLIIDGLPTSVTGYLLAGDYIQLGTGVTSSLYKVLTQVDTNGSGQATLTLWPSVITAPVDNATVTLTSPKGLFRLANNTASWEINNISSYGITFDCVGVL